MTPTAAMPNLLSAAALAQPPAAAGGSQAPAMDPEYRGKREIPADAKPFDEHFKGRRKELIKDYEEPERYRMQIIVTMIKRYRGDSLGFFYKNRWETMPSQGLKKYNLFWPVVRSNNTNWVSTDIQLKFEPSRSDPETQAGATVCETLHHHVFNRHWTESFEEMMAEFAQLQLGYHIESYFSKNEGVGTIKVPLTTEANPEEEGIASSGEYICAACGSGGPNEVLDPQNPLCPECGQSVQAGESEQAQPYSGALHSGYSQMPEGENAMRLRSSFTIRLDEANAVGGDPAGAYWFNHHDLYYRYELYQLMPWLKEKLQGKKSGEAWSESLQWKRALEMSAGTLRSNLGDTKGDKQTGRSDDLLEYCRWWFMKVAVDDYVAPEYYKHPCGWDIYPGENCQDAFERLGKPYDGLYITFVCDEIGFIASDDKNKRWTGGGWGMNASGYWCKGQEDLLDFQEVVNELLTLMVDNAMHNSLPHLILDGKMFDRQNFKNKAGAASYTRKGLQRDKPIEDYFAQLLPGDISASVPMLMSQMLDGAQNTMGVQPSTVGAPDPTDKTFAGQQLKRQASVGLLIPSQKMKKRAKIAAARHQLILCQKYWPNERIARVMSTAEHSWDDADIAAFKAMDLERDVNITGIEGSDIPVTHQEKEMKLGGLIGSGIIGNPQIPKELQSLAFQYAGVPYDTGDYEAQVRSSDSRLREIRELCQLARDASIAYTRAPDVIPDPADPTGMTMIPNPAAGMIIPNEEVIVMILQQPNVKMLPRQDDHQTHIEFFNRHIVALAASPKVDEFELSVLMHYVDEHILQVALNARDQVGMETFAQQPMADAEAANQPQKPDPAAGEEAKQKGQADADSRKRDMATEADDRKSEESERARQHDRVENQKNRSHDLAMAKTKPKPGKK